MTTFNAKNAPKLAGALPQTPLGELTGREREEGRRDNRDSQGLVNTPYV